MTSRPSYFRVLAGPDGRYGIWPVDSPLPEGWLNGGFIGPRPACLAYVSQRIASSAPAGSPPAGAEPALAALWRRTAGHHADAVAVRHGPDRLTYRELDAQAAILAASLAAYGAGPSTPVGLDLPPGLDLAVALVGAVKSGAAYVTNPSGYALGHVALSGSVGAGWKVRSIEAPAPSGWPGTQTAAAIHVDPESAAAVAFGHRELAALLDDPGLPRLRPGDGVLAAAASDLSALQIWWPLRHGATVEFTDDDEHASGSRPRVRRLRVRQGETVSEVPLFGCAETMTVCARPTTGPGGQTRLVPREGVELYVLDGGLRPATDDVPGDLFVGGALALGYLGQPERTVDRFRPDPFRPGAVMYATGVIVRRHAGAVVLEN